MVIKKEKRLSEYIFLVSYGVILPILITGLIMLIYSSVGIYINTKLHMENNLPKIVGELFESVNRKTLLMIFQCFQKFKDTLYKLEIISYTAPEKIDNFIEQEYENKYSENFLELNYYFINASGIIYKTNYEKDLGLDLSKFFLFWETLNKNLDKSNYYLQPLAKESSTGKLRVYAYKRMKNGDILELGFTLKPKLLGEEFSVIKDLSPFLEQISILQNSEPISPIFKNPSGETIRKYSFESLYKYDEYIWKQIEIDNLPVNFYIYFRLNFFKLFLIPLQTLILSILIVFAYFVLIKYVSKRISGEIKKMEMAMSEKFKGNEYERSFIREVNDALEFFSKQNEHIQELSKEVREAFYDFAFKLVYVVEGLEEGTAKHLERVRFIVEKIAERLVEDKDLREDIVYFAPLHDIGKIFVPAEILNKPDKLTQEEWEEMKKHTVYAERLLDHPRFKVALNIAKYHHENYDGSGYSEGLKGEEIPIEARIVKIADVYDALVSERPYKRAYSKEEALKIIFEGDERVKPKHFDPKVLEAFREIVDEI